MDKIKLLQQRIEQIHSVGTDIRNDIKTLIDQDSFVESSIFSFSKNEFYGENAEGEGVVTGFATINDYPYYIVAQNANVFNGGISKANCQKIAKCIEQAEKNDTPIIYLLSSNGVQIGEGVNVLEGLATLLLKAAQLKGSITQYLIINGNVFGQIALLAGMCDFTFFIQDKSVLACNSPLVISASSNQNVGAQEVGGVKALTGSNLASFNVKSLQEVKDTIIKITELCSETMIDCDNLNDTLAKLNKNANTNNLLQIFDANSIVELGAMYCPEVKCILARLGGISVACLVFDGEDGVYLTAQNVRKMKDFAEFVSFNNLPYITFVNTLGIKPDMQTANSLVIKELAEYITILDCLDMAKISVVYKKAIGLGYTIFAAKSMGYDYSFAFANSQIALFDSVQGAEIEFANNADDKEKLAKKYADENSDPINAAKNGYIDNIVEPALIKQYLIASLQMLIK